MAPQTPSAPFLARSAGRTALAAVCCLTLFLALFLALTGTASAEVVGYYDMQLGRGNANQVASISTAGHTPMELTDVRTANLAGIEVLYVQNPINGAYGVEYLARLADIDAAVAGGLVLILHDAYVTGACTVLPGSDDFGCMMGSPFTRDPQNEIDIRDTTTPVTSSDGRVLTDTSLDNGLFSNHGYVDADSTPFASRLILNRGAASNDEIVTMSYPYGDGAVIYSTIPLAAFLSDPPGSPRAAFSQIYAPNVVDYGVLLSRGIPDVVISVTDDAATAVPGEAHSYTVEVLSFGPGTATTWDVAATFQELTGINWTCSASGTGSCGASGMGAIADTVTLAVGEAATYSVTGTLASSATGTVTAVATVTPPLGVDDPIPTNNTDTDNTLLTPIADLVLTKEAQVARVDPGDMLVYELTVTNEGPSDATGVLLTDPTPNGIEFVSSTGSCATTAPTEPFPCALMTIAAGASKSVTATYQVPANYAGPDTIDNRAAVSADPPDPEPDDNRARTATPVGRDGSADLELVAAGPPTAAAGSTVTYRVTTTNHGPDEARDVTLSHTPAAGLTFLSATDPCSGGFPCDLGTLAPGASLLVEVTFGIPGGFVTSPFTYTAMVVSSTADPGPNANNDSVQVTLGADTADLAVTKSGPTSADAGDLITYTLTVTNRGPATATNVTLTDPTPADLTFDSASSPCALFPCSLGTLAVGESVTVEAVFLVPSDYAGSDIITNTASASADETDGNPDNDSDSAITGFGGEVVDLSLAKSGPESTAPGSSLTYTLEVANEGPGTVFDVMLADPGPAGVALTPTADAPCEAGFPCDLGDLPAGAAFLLGVTYDLPSDLTFPDPLLNTAMAAGTGIDPDTGNNSDDASVDLVARADLAVTKDDGEIETSPGLTVTYTIVVTNNGPTDVTGATVEDPFSAEHESISWTCTGDAGTSCAGGDSGTGAIDETVDLPAGTSITYIAMATVAAAASGTLDNTATVTVPAGVEETDASNNSADDSNVVVQPADLVVSKSGPASVNAGTSVTFTIVVDNDGTGEAADVELVDDTPAGLTLQSVPAGCAATAGGFSCDLGTIAASGTAMVTVTYDVPAGYTGPAMITNTASADTTSPEPDTGNNSDSAVTDVVFSADLQATKTDGKLEVVPGTATSYTIVVQNFGPSDADGTTIVDSPPAQLINVSWTCVESGGATCPAPSGTDEIDETVDLPAGGTLTFTLNATVDPAANLAVVNDVAVIPAMGLVHDPVPGNNLGSDSSGLSPVSDLMVTKDDGLDELVPGEPVTYIVTVTNLGPSAAPGVTVTDDLPDALLGATWTCTPSGGAMCTAMGSGDIDEMVDLPAGGSVVFEITATVDPAATGTLENTASADVPVTHSDPNPGDNSATDTADLVRVADLSIVKRGPDTIDAGESLVYTVTVANDGPSNAAVTVTDPLPPGLTLTSVEAPCAAGFPCSFDLAAGASVSFDVTYAVPTDYLDGNPPAPGFGGLDPIVNRAAVSSDAIDPRPADNLAASATPVGRMGSADLAITKRAAEVSKIGSTVDYLLTVTNLGPEDAFGVMLDEDIPDGLTFNSATAPCESGFLCDLGQVSRGESVEVTVTLNVPAGYVGPNLIVNNASVTAATPDPTPGNNSASDLTTLISDPIDLRLTKRGPTRVELGEDLTYLLRVENLGPAEATNIQLMDPTPTGLTFVSAGAPCAGGLPCFLGSLMPGEAIELPVTFNVPAGYGGPNPIVNTATVTANQLDASPDNGTATALTGVGAEAADVSVTKEGPPQIAAGSAITYALVVRNDGPGTATVVNLLDPTPAGTTFVSATAPCAGGFPCALGDLTPGSAVVVHATFATDADLVPPVTITNTATVETTSADSDAGNDSASVGTDVVRRANLAITKSASPDPEVVPGEAITYTIIVTNAGPSDNPSVQVVDTFPTELNNVSWTCSAGGGASCAPGAAGNGDIDRTVSIPAGGSVTYTAIGTVDPSATDTIENTATVVAPAEIPDPDESDNEDSVTTTLTPMADLEVVKTDGSTTAVPGTQVTYIITVTNAGPSDAPDVTVTDMFPAELSDIEWTCMGTNDASCTASGSDEILELVDLPAGSSVVFTATGDLDPSATGILENTASAAHGAGLGVVDPDTGNNSSTDQSTLTPMADIELTKEITAAGAVPGAAAEYIITVSNNGPSDAPGVNVVDLFNDPAITAVSWACTPDPGASCSNPNGTGALDESVDLPVGTSAVFVSLADLDAAATGQLTNTATASTTGDVTDPNTDNNSETLVTPLTREVDLVVTKDNGVTSVVAGTPVSYTVTVTNAGPSNVTGAIVGDLVPATLTGVTWTCVAAPTGVCTAAGTGDIADVINLPAGSTATYMISGSLAADARGDLVNTATADPPAGTTEIDPGDNSATDSDPIDVVADVTVEKTAEPLALLDPGDTVTYTITVSNAGPSDVNGVTVTDVFPAADLSGVTWTCSEAGGGTCPAPSGSGDIAAQVDLPVGTSVTFEATATVEPGAGPIVNTAEATLTTEGTDPNPGDNSADVTVTRTEAIFSDGFESGDTTMWDLVVN